MQQQQQIQYKQGIGASKIRFDHGYAIKKQLHNLINIYGDTSILIS
jgi:hypothetical protein